MTTLITSSKGWIVIPAELHKKYGLLLVEVLLQKRRQERETPC
jgi:bifunctional DNA-binding transcriptional regulator/antitoxin component of YhaV-PrlF toxin-antitoxin module